MREQLDQTEIDDFHRDGFVLLLTHGLMLIAAWRLLGRRDLDNEAADPRAGQKGRRPDA